MLGALALALVPATGQAVVTIGSSLPAASGGTTCQTQRVAGPCTMMHSAVPTQRVVSPFKGVVVRWRLRDSAGTFALRIVGSPAVARPVGKTVDAPVGTPGGLSVFPTRVPIAAGDAIGVDVDASASIGTLATNLARAYVFGPPLGVGEARNRQTLLRAEVLFNADVEPDADGDLFGDETQDACARDATTQGACPGRCANEARGTEGDDALAGTEAGDNMLGLGGADHLRGAGGDDCLFGGSGTDALVGGAGQDRLRGEDGADTLDGGGGDDRLSGGRDADRISGGDGRDVIAGEDGADRADAGAGDDTVDGGPGNDALQGGPGRDDLRGQAGDDRLSGGSGDDRIDGGTGANSISGGAGRDDIRAANGRRDRITCGAGRDRVRADRRDRVARDCERVTRPRR